SLGYLLLWFKTNDRSYIIVFAAASAVLPWIKSEGIILWAVVVLVGLGLSFAKNRLAQFLIAVAPGLLVIFGWRLYLKLVHISLPSDFSRPSLSFLRENAGRMGEILAILLAEMSETEHWSIFWLLTAVALVYLSASRKLEKLALASAVIVPALLYALIYLFSTWPSYSAHMTSSFPRLVLQVMPTGWLAIGLALSQLKGETGTL